MTNTNKLKGKIRECGLTQSEVARNIGISSTSFTYKINNKREFTVKEIVQLVGLLGIRDKDSYFFI